MKIRFNIAFKVGISYGLLFILWIAGIYIAQLSFERSSKDKSKIIENYQPASKLLVDLALDISKSKQYSKEIVYNNNVHENKKLLADLQEVSYNKTKSQLIAFSNLWREDKSKQLLNIFSKTDSLFFEQKMLVDQKTDNNLGNSATTNIEINKKLESDAENIVASVYELSIELNERINKNTKELFTSIENIQNIYFWVGVALFFVILIIVIGTVRDIVMPIKHLSRTLKKMNKGELPDKLIKTGSDEIGQMSKSLNNFIIGLKKISKFSQEIGEENYTVDFKPLGPKDELGNSLLLMRDNLKRAFRENMIRRKENFQRSWTSQGLAEFSEMLRESKDDLEELTNQILVKLIRYLDANVGGLFILNDENKDDVFLELLAFYAYDRRKYINKRIEVGESLVGQCVLENETIFMTEIPKDYLHITSGTGRDNPRSLLIVPLKLNEEVYGVVELASFRTIEKYQIEFVEKIGESIASTLSSVKVNIHTSKLLQESNEKSQRLTKQEKEYKKQIDDMEKSLNNLKQKLTDEQEEHKKLIANYQLDILNLRKQNDISDANKEKLVIEMKNIARSLDNAIGTYSLSINGEFLEANDKYLKLVKLSLKDLKEKRISDLIIDDSVRQAVDIHKFTPILLSEQKYEQKNKYIIDGEPVWLKETFTPLYDEHGKFVKIFCIVKDETDITKTDIEKNAVIEKLKSDVKKLKQRV